MSARATWPARCRRAWRPATSRTYSREQELQADQLGAEYLSRTSYDPQNMVDVIQRAARTRSASPPTTRAPKAARRRRRGELARLAPDQRPAPAATSAQIAAQLQGQGRLQRRRPRALPAGGRRHDVRREPRAGRHARPQLLPRAARHRADRAAGLVDPELAPTRSRSSTAPATPGWWCGWCRRRPAARTRRSSATSIKPEQGRIERLALGGGLPATHFVGTRRNAAGAGARHRGRRWRPGRATATTCCCTPRATPPRCSAHALRCTRPSRRFAR